MGRMRREWQQAEIDQLIKLYARGERLDAIGVALQRRYESVSAKLKSLFGTGAIHDPSKPLPPLRKMCAEPKRRSRESVAHHHATRGTGTTRRCMCCLRPFRSTGSMNRLCYRCCNSNPSPYAP